MSTKNIYITAVLIFIAGAAIFSLYVYKNYVSLNELLVELEMPGEGRIMIEAPGDFELFYEYETGRKSLLDEENTIPGFALRVRDQQGNYIPVSKPLAAKKYNYMGKTGISVFQINPGEAGIYTVVGDFVNGDSGQRFSLTFDTGFSEKRSRTIVNAQALFLFPIIVSLILFLYAYSRARLKKY